MTCTIHTCRPPERQCSFCGHIYCDAGNHGHTPEVCLNTLWRDLEQASRHLEDTIHCLRVAEKRYRDMEAAKEKNGTL